MQLFSVGELLISLRTATSRDLARHGYRRGYAVWLLTIDAVRTCTATLYVYVQVYRGTALSPSMRCARICISSRAYIYQGLSLDFLAVHGPDALLLALDRWLSPHQQPPLPLGSPPSSYLHERLMEDAAVGCARAWDGVQRAWRDTPLMRAVVGYQRLHDLPSAPWPIQKLIDEQLLPAYFGEGLQASWSSSPYSLGHVLPT